MQQSFVSSSATSLSWRGFANGRLARITPTHQIGEAGGDKESRITVRPRDESRGLQCDRSLIRERWVRFFRSLQNAKSKILDPNIPKRLPQQPVASALKIEPREEINTQRRRQWQTQKQSGRTVFPLNCANSDFNKIRLSCWSSTDPPPSSGAKGRPRSSGNTRSLLFSTRRTTRRSVGTNAAYRSCHTQVRWSSEVIPGDLALTVR